MTVFGGLSCASSRTHNIPKLTKIVETIESSGIEHLQTLTIPTLKDLLIFFFGRAKKSLSGLKKAQLVVEATAEYLKYKNTSSMAPPADPQESDNNNSI